MLDLRSEDENSLPTLGHPELSRIRLQDRDSISGARSLIEQRPDHTLISGVQNARNVLKQECIGRRLAHQSPELCDERSPGIGPGYGRYRWTFALFPSRASPPIAGFVPESVQ